MRLLPQTGLRLTSRSRTPCLVCAARRLPGAPRSDPSLITGVKGLAVSSLISEDFPIPDFRIQEGLYGCKRRRQAESRAGGGGSQRRAGARQSRGIPERSAQDSGFLRRGSQARPARRAHGTTLYRTLSAKGNPSLKTLQALLKAMNMRLAVVATSTRQQTEER